MHHLPTGGALRVLAEWLSRTTASSIIVYTRDARGHEFASLPPEVPVVERRRPAIGGDLGKLLDLLCSPLDGKRLAMEVDRQRFDAVFCFASYLTQAPEVLPYLRTPAVYYAPEPLRSAYEPRELLGLPSNWRGALTRAGLNPLELVRKRLDRRYMRAARHVVTHSRFTQEVLRRVYGVESVIVPLGVDPAVFCPAPVEREPYVLSIGALHPLKGHELVLEAIAMMRQPRARLVVIGDRGSSEQRLRRLATSAGIELEIHHGIPTEKVVDLYRRAAAVACGQIREPFGLVPLEAMACETPVVAVADGGFRETLRNGETGVLVDRDPVAMARALERVLRDRELALRLGHAGREEVVLRWSWERTVRGFDELLQAAAQGAHS